MKLKAKVRSQPGEAPVYRVQRGRGWQNLLLTVLVDTAILIAVFYLFNYLDRAFVETYIRPANSIGRAEFMVLNLFLGIVPLLTLLALIQDFLFTFFIHLDLTTQRFTGRVPGLLWVKEVNISLDQVAQVKLAAGHLLIYEFGGRRLVIRGLPDLDGLAHAYHRLRLGSAGAAADTLPDAFTFEKVHS